VNIARRSRIELLQSVWLFDGCSRRQLDRLATLAEPLDVPAGRRLTREGEPRREFLIIVDGKAEVTRRGQQLAILGPGDFIGETSLLDRQERVAIVVTLEPTTLLAMTAASFDALVDDMPSIARNILTVVSRRLRDLEAKYVTARA
jgi:CRP-like cAMP-binding protein